MCLSCESTESFCLCGSNQDPDGHSEPCGAKSAAAYCSTCGHSARAIPLDSPHGSDYQEF